MTTLLLLPSSLFSTSVIMLAASMTMAVNPDKAQVLSKAHFEFSLDLYRTLEPNQSSGNLMVSPYSVNLALSMLFLGTSSSSNSSRQLRSIMHFDDISYVDVHNQFKNVVSNFDSNYYQAKMKIAHSLYVAEDVAISPPYDRALREFYQSRIEHMDFRNADTSQTLGVINEFVDEVTDGKIEGILEGPPDAEARLLAFNALTLTARWLFPFDEKDTFDKGLFFLPDGQRLEVPTMEGQFELPLGYSSELECQVLEMPFSQKRVSMFLLMPDDPVEGLSRLEANISTENIKMLFSTLKDEIVNVKLPKFEMRSSIDLYEPLRQLGLVDLLEKDTSDLGLMAPTDTLKLSSIKHKSKFEVGEGGSSAKSALEAKGGFGQKHFEVDHSFMFLVWDYYSGMLLLMGRVVNPLQV